MNSATRKRPVMRTWWTFVAGLLLWALILLLFGRLLDAASDDTPPPAPIDAQLVELPASRAPTPASHAAPRQEQKPVQRAAPSKPLPTRPPVHPLPAKPQPPAISRPAAARPATTAKPEAKPTPAPQPAAPTSPAASQAASGSAAMGARAIYRPLPHIPDELRNEAIRTEALARFHIRPDGSVDVELLQATSDPRINQLILNTLRTWKFFPALQDGKPVSSVQDVRVKIDVS